MKPFYLLILSVFMLLPNLGCVSSTGLAAADGPLFRLVKTVDGKMYTTEWSSDGSRVILVESGFVPEPTPGEPKPDPKPEDPKPNPTAGDCSSTIYEKTGRKIDLPGEKGTRNYASGKPSEPTWESEKNVDESWEDYELTAYVTLNEHHKKDDDNIDWKMYGPNHKNGNKGWYVFGISSDGEAICGAEDKHPSDNPKWKCTGGDKTDFGNIKFKKVGLKAVIYRVENGDVRVQSFLDEGDGKWVKMADQTNPGGRKFKPQDPQNLLLRVDGFPKINVHCAVAQEIKEPK
jgi:hypothetical protein